MPGKSRKGKDMIEWPSLALFVISAVLLVVLGRTWRATTPKLRWISGLARLYRAFGLSVEDGTRVLVALGGASLFTRNGGSALAGLALLRLISQKASISDRPPVAVAGEAVLAVLAQDTMQAGYRESGAADYFQPATGRLAGLTPFSSVAATISMLEDEHVSLAALIGHFGVESGLLSDAAERSSVFLIGATGDPAAQSVLYATTPEPLIGEELFAVPAYFGGDSSHGASLAVQDILRWVIILALFSGAVLRLLGVI